MKNNLTVYRRVFDRKTVANVDLETFLLRPEEVLNAFGEKGLNKLIGVIKRTKDKEYRNYKKRENLPVAEMFTAGALVIDLDDLLGDEGKINGLVSILRDDAHCHCIKGTPSKNLMAVYKVDCTEEDFPKVYYKLYLELTLKLGIHIDYLPEPGRQRYLSNGRVFYYNPDSVPLTEMLHVKVPIITKDSFEIEEEVEETKGGHKIKKTRKRFINGSNG